MSSVYDVALSFAGEDRPLVAEVAEHLTRAGIEVFYDKYEETDLWGKNLIDQFTEVFSKQARFVMMFVSKSYATKMWPNTERQIAQAKALVERREYILPVRIDDTELPGLPPTVAYLDARKVTPKELALAAIQKVGPRSNIRQATTELPEIVEKLILETQLISIEPGTRAEFRLDAGAGDTILGSLRSAGGKLFNFEILDEENLMLKASKHGKKYELIVAGNNDNAYFVKPTQLPHAGPWFLCATPRSSWETTKIQLNLRRQTRSLPKS